MVALFPDSVRGCISPAPTVGSPVVLIPVPFGPGLPVLGEGGCSALDSGIVPAAYTRLVLDPRGHCPYMQLAEQTCPVSNVKRQALQLTLMLVQRQAPCGCSG